MSASFLSRRYLLGAAAALSLGALPFGRARAADPLTIGFIDVGPKDDYGYNQAHAQGAAILKAPPGVQVVEEENVRETTDVQKTMESMINLEGASLWLDRRVMGRRAKDLIARFKVKTASSEAPITWPVTTDGRGHRLS